MTADLTDALAWVDTAVSEKTGHTLKGPEIVILEGTWRGLTYEQMAEGSEYSTNYLMRDVAPKLWKQLSSVFERPVGKTNFRIALETYASTHNLSSSLSAGPQSVVSSQPKRTYGSTFLGRAIDRAEGRERAWVPSPMYGYSSELTQIKRWLSDALAHSTQDSKREASTSAQRKVSPNRSRRQGRQSRLVGVWGLSGIGKSLLCETVVDQIGASFETVIWRSLKSKPTLSDFCAGVLNSLGMGSPAVASVSPSVVQPIEKLLDVLSQRPILLVIECLESILQSGVLAGSYQSQYQAYDDFFQSIAGSRSCLLVTGTEGPTNWVNQAGHYKNQPSIYLTGLSEAAATTLLASESLAAPEHWSALIARYQGHPFALQSAARVIREIFSGRVDVFLQQTSVLFTDIMRLLSPSFNRLSESELSILYWLATQTVPLTFTEIQRSLPTQISTTDLVSALDSLKQRSYLSIEAASKSPTFQLPALIHAYALHQLTAQFSEQSSSAFSSAQRAATNEMTRFPVATPGSIITLGTSTAHITQLSQWFQGRIHPSWQSLNQLITSVESPSMRLRNTYHLMDETFIKRCKSVRMMYENAQSVPGYEEAAEAILVVAIRQEAENLYKICVQVQPRRGVDALPEALELRLLDDQQALLAQVQAVQADTFIQLPYFQGEPSESFGIELVLHGARYTETFSI